MLLYQIIETSAVPYYGIVVSFLAVAVKKISACNFLGVFLKLNFIVTAYDT